MANNQGISRENRYLPPAHYTVKIKSYTELFKPPANLERFESGIFEAGCYKWRLVFYPNGNKKDGGDGHISLYLAIDKSNAFSDKYWNVHVSFKLFVQDDKLNNYLAVQDAKGPVRRFDKNKTEWGFGKFLNLETFNEPSNGYLVDDSCVFGAEVFVIEHTGKGESISILRNPPGSTDPWKIENFSKLDDFPICSDIYNIGHREWIMELCPRGNNGKDGNLSIFLNLYDLGGLPLKRAVYGEYKLRLVDQLRQVNSFERKYSHWFIKTDEYCGDEKFISHKDLYNTINGYVMDDVVIVELEFLSVSVIKLD